MKGIAAWAIRNRAWVEVLIFVWLIGGLVSLFGIRKEFFPEISFDSIHIVTTLPSATAEDVERLLTDPLEDGIVDLPGIEHVQSFSREGRSDIFVTIDPDHATLEEVRRDIERAIENTSDLPEDAEDPAIIEMKMEAPVLVAAILGDASWTTRKRIADGLEDQFRGVPGVSSVIVAGLRRKEFSVEVDPAQLAIRGLSSAHVIEAIRAADADLPAGRLEARGGDILVRTAGKISTPEELEQVVVRAHPEGLIRVRDVANVREILAEEQTRSRVNGKPATILTILKSKEADVLEVSEALRAIVAQEQAALPTGLTLTYVQDSSEWVEERLGLAWYNGLQGLLLVFIILAVFLDLQSALWCAYGIVSAILGGILILYATGGTLNMLSIFGFILVLGMLDDDAITVVENVSRYREKGMDPIRAIIQGAGEVARPLTASILTTMASLLALAMMTGIMGKFMAEIPKPGIYCLAATLLEALLTIPIHLYLTAHWKRPRLFTPLLRLWDKTARAWGDRTMNRLRKAHRKVLYRTLRHRYLFLAAVAVAFVASVFAGVTGLRFVLVHTTDTPLFTVEVTAPAGTSFDEVERIVSRIESRIMELPPDEIESVSTTIGSRREQVIEFDREVAQIMVDLHEPDIRKRNADQIMADLRPKLAEIGGAEIILKEMEGGPPVGKPVNCRVSGNDWAALSTFADEIKGYIAELPGATDVEKDLQEGKLEAVIRPLADASGMAGTSPAQLAIEVRVAVDGVKATSIRQENEEVEIRVRYPEIYRERVADLEKIQVPTSAGPAPLLNLAGLSLERGLSKIKHYDGQRTVTISADLMRDGIESREATRLIEEKFSAEARSRGMSISMGGEAEETNRSVNSLAWSAFLAVSLIAIILVIQFGNFLQPLVIIATLPLAVIGVVLTLLVHSLIFNLTGLGVDAPMGLMPMIGLTALLGMVVNDAIVLVDFVNESRARGAGRWRSLLTAGWQRLRPVILASLTTAAGVLPMAYTLRGSSSFLAPMALVFGWGIICATILTLLVIPNLLAIVDDFKRTHPPSGAPISNADKS